MHSVLRSSLVSMIFSVLVILIANPAQSNGRGFSAKANQLFDIGIEFYEKKAFSEAKSKFEQLLQLPNNHRSSAATLMVGKCYFRLGDFDSALSLAINVEASYPSSRYVADSYLLRADVFYKKKRFFEAAEHYGRLLSVSSPLSLQAIAAERLTAIVANKQISNQAVEKIRQFVGDSRMHEALLFGEVLWYRRLGWIAESKMALKNYRDAIGAQGVFFRLGDLPGTVLGSNPLVVNRPVSVPNEREELIHLPTGEKGSKKKLGLLLPLSGTYASIAQEIYNGVEMANVAAGHPFEIIIEDSGIDYGTLPINSGLNSDLQENNGSGLLRVARGAKKLVDQQVVGIIGPLFSSACVAAAVVAEASRVPLIAPLSQQSGLDSLGQFIFQINSVPELQGKMLGEHASLVLGMHNLVVIAPLTDYGWNFEREFRKTTEENGGRVALADWYIPNQTKDFRRIFEAVRKVGFELSPTHKDTLSAVDSLRSVGISEANQDSSFLLDLLEQLKREEALIDSLYPETEVDSTKIFIDSIDGVVLVVEDFSDAQTIAPQLAFHRLNTQILGNSLWFDPEGLKNMRRSERKYLEGAIIASPHQEDLESGRNFIDDYRKTYLNDPRYAAFGFDSAQLLIKALIDSDGEVAKIHERLSEVKSYEGASGRIKFDADRRVNSALSLLKIERDRYKSVLTNDLPELGNDLGTFFWYDEAVDTD
ncbi:MAG: ABC transporter substrate-binding protein [Candidatus Latescibacterota bacterium]|nr:ABC transporter substrate-binding protein [Candidatus Latescibacterota bacterium]